MTPPLECTLCGMPRLNDTTVRWVRGLPYCAEWCADRADLMDPPVTTGTPDYERL